jgi:Transposase, Mutator family
MTKLATGVSLKTGQANLAVKTKSHDTIEAHLGQFFWIPSLINAYKESDPEGTYMLEEDPCVWDSGLRQFRRCYVCLLTSKHFWSNASIRLLSCDGTHTRNNCFKQVVLITTAYDGNNNIVVLAFAIVDVEDGDNWTWYKEQLEEDFLGISIWMSDKGKGITSNAFQLNLSQSVDEFAVSRCARHIAENCKEQCKKGLMNEHYKKMIINLAKSITEETY